MANGDHKALGRAARPASGADGRLTKADWLTFGLKALGDGGPGAIRLDALCQRLGVTKGSFYWHFQSRNAFLEAVLDRWASEETDAIIDRVEAAGGGPIGKLRSLFEESAAPDIDFAPELAIRQWARTDPAAAAAVDAVDARRIDYMDGLFRAAGFADDEAKLRSDMMYAAIISQGIVRWPKKRKAHKSRRRVMLDRFTTMP